MITTPTTLPTPEPVSLMVSIVCFVPDMDWLEKTLMSLDAALVDANARDQLRNASIRLVNNGNGNDSALLSLLEATITQSDWCDMQLISGHGNIGYGAANNLALKNIHADVYLVLNPDVVIARDAIAEAISYLTQHPQCGMITPIATFPDGASQYLVKRMPDVFTLALRGFAPAFIRKIFARRLTAYDRADVAFDAPLTDAQIASGCWMLIRGDIWARTKGFDKRFFLYFEDFDLSLRIAQLAQIHRVPACRIVHAGGNAATKGRHHIGLFIASARYFFSKYGWRWW